MMKRALGLTVAGGLLAALVAVLPVLPADKAVAGGLPGPVDCVGPAGDPAPGTQAWSQRDALNQYCATQRIQDEYANPAFAATFWSETPGIFGAQTAAQAESPTHPHLSLGQLIPGGTTGDPFRTLSRWTGSGRGRATAISFTATDGAQLNGYVFEPPTAVPGPYPGVVITTGSIQGYQQLYFWAAEGLAEAGYMVLTYDVQGQGDSDTFPNPCNPTAAGLQSQNVCTGVPFQQSYNFFQGARDAMNFFVSSASAPFGGSSNPARADLDVSRIGVAGHSLGASAVSQVGQDDPRVKAIVAWDNLAPTTPGTALHAPALGINSEYFFNPSPMSSVPDPHSKDQAFVQLSTAGIDTMQVALRSSMHLEYSYVPYILPASRLGERVAFYYSLAWFDYYLRGSAAAYNRLVARSFDPSADASSIGAGTYDPALAAADPTNVAAGNVPPNINGLAVPDRLSFYYRSGYSLTSPGGVHAGCADLRSNCLSG